MFNVLVEMASCFFEIGGVLESVNLIESRFNLFLQSRKRFVLRAFTDSDIILQLLRHVFNFLYDSTLNLTDPDFHYFRDHGDLFFSLRSFHIHVLIRIFLFVILGSQTPHTVFAKQGQFHI